MILITMPAEKIKSPNISIDDSLIFKIAQGDMEALREIYNATSHAIYGFALSITKNKQDAEDVLQETYIKLVSASKTYKPKGKAMALLFTIARNLCLMKFRESQKMSLENVDIDTKEDLSFNMIENSSDRLVLEKVLKELGGSEREIIILHLVAGFKFREIAQILELPQSTVLSKHSRAIKKLKLILEQEEY